MYHFNRTIESQLLKIRVTILNNAKTTYHNTIPAPAMLITSDVKRKETLLNHILHKFQVHLNTGNYSFFDSNLYYDSE